MKRDILELMEEEFIGYSAPILINNLPSIDGLLPVHRKVLWGLHRNGVTHKKGFIKMLRASAMAMSYYTFGDMPLTQAMKNMANNSLNHLYLMPKGSFGNKNSKEGVGASPRYIECKLDEYGEDLLKNIEKSNVDMKRNFDDTEYEPIILPSLIPNILTNTSQSIAVGEASKIPAHNLSEVCDGIISYIDTNDIDKTIDIIKCPDLSLGGGIIYNKDTFDKIYKTGKGSFSVIGKYDYDEKKNVFCITEIPYETYKETIEQKIRECYDKGLFKEIVDIHDDSDKDGISIKIYLKKNTNLQTFVSKLRKYTPFESKFPCNFTILDLDYKTPKLMTLEDIIQRWVKHRENCLIRECKFDIAKNEKELNRLLGLKVINEDLDKAIEIIKSSKKESIALENLKKHFGLNDGQAEYISTIRLVNINQEWIAKKIENIDELKTLISKLNKFINSKTSIHRVIKKQLEEVKNKYGKKRFSEIIIEEKTNSISEEVLIEDYSTTMVLTKEGYLKKTLRYADKEKQKVKEGDEIISIIQTTNKGEVVLIGDKGNAYKIPIHTLDDTQPSNLGSYLHSTIDIEKDEKIIGMLATNYGKLQWSVIVYENGKVAKIPMKSYQTKTNRSKLKNCLTFENGKVISILQVNDKEEYIYLESNYKKALAIKVSNISEKKSKDSVGVQIMKSTLEDFRIIKTQIQNEEDSEDYKVDKASAGKKIK